MAEIDRYRLTLLFDTSQISPEDLDQRARAALLKHLPTVELRLEPIDAGRAELSIVGSLEDVDACHEKLNAELFDRRYCVRLLDEAGDEIRQEAYPILAQIEQRLRAFINRAMTEVIGFDWWDRMTPPALQRSVEEMEKKVGQLSGIHHPVELTYFEQLLGMVTGSLQQWPRQRPLSVADLAELLSHCDSVDEIRTKLADKTRKVSLWDEVFARYFEQGEEWTELEKGLHKSVIPVRHKVMHHRPIRLSELQDLSRIQESARTLLSSAKPELPQKERMEAREVGMDLIDVIRRDQAEWAQARQAMLQPFLEQQAELARLGQEELAQARQAALQPFLQQQAQLAQLGQEELAQARQAILQPFLQQQAQLAQLGQEELAQARQANLQPFLEQQTQWAQARQAMLQPFLEQQAEWAQAQQAILEPFRRLHEQMAPPPERLVERPSTEADADEEQSPMTYRVYENWTVRPDKAIIHRSDCPYANSGPIPSPTKNGQWHGPFATYREALEVAEGTGREDVRGCRHCKPR